MRRGQSRALRGSTGINVVGFAGHSWPLSVRSLALQRKWRRHRATLSAWEDPAVSHWNYRVVESRDQTEYFIAEVYYADDGHLGWADDSRDCLRWDNYDDLKGTVDLIREAFDQPLLRVVEGDRLVEVT